MFKKLNLKTLLILFGGLLVLVVILQVFSNKKGDRNFKSQLFEADTAKISAIMIKTKASKEEIRLNRNGHVWTFNTNGKTYKVDRPVIASMLSEIAKLRPQRVAATEKSEWAAFEVVDTMATRVKIEQGGRVVADFLIGKFSFQQNPQRMSTFIRLSNDDEVYAVDGFLAMTFNKTANDLRNKTLVNVSASNITRVSFTYPADSSYVLSREKHGWNLNGQPADSTKVANFIYSLSNTNGGDIANDNLKPGPQLYTVKVEGNNFNAVEIKAFAADSDVIITSNQNPDAQFNGKNSGLSNRIFVGGKQFLKK